MGVDSAGAVSLKSVAGTAAVSRVAVNPVVETGKFSGDTYCDVGDPDYEHDGGDIHGSSESGSSIPAAIFNLLKTIIGAGIFTMPSAFLDGGFFTSIVLLVALGAVVNWTVTILVRTGIEANLRDYERLVKLAMGSWGYYSYLVAALMFAYGGCAAYTVVVADRFPAVINAFSNIAYEDIATEASTALKFIMDRRIAVLVVSVLVLFPISSMKYLKSLAFTSFAGVAMFAWVALTSLILAWTLPEDQRGSTNPSDIYTIIKPAGVVSVLSRAAFSVVCHHNQFMIYRSIKNPSLKRYFIVSRTSIWLSALMGVLFGILGYIPLVEKASAGNILNALPEDNIWVKIASLAFCIDVILTYPLELFVCRDILEKVVHGSNRHNIGKVIRLGYTALLVAGTILIGVIVCDLNDVVDITGGMASAAIAFIFPPAIYIILKRRGPDAKVPLYKYIPHFLCILFGAFMAIYTVASVIVSALTSTTSKACAYKVL